MTLTVAIGQLLFVACVTAFGYVAAALMLGLLLGERGRRRAVERLVLTGTTEVIEEPKPVSMAPAKEAEDRFREAAHEVSEATITRAVQDLRALAKFKGEAISDEQLEHDVRMMFAQQDVN